LGTIAANPAESAAAEPNYDLATFTPEQYTAWESTGKIPDAKPAESSPAPSTESQAGASSDDEPAAESAPASQEQPPKGKAARNADSRIQELLRDRAELKARLEALEKPAAKTESAPAKPAETELKRPARPVFGEAGHESETWAQFEDRQDAHVEALAEYKAKSTWQQTREAEQKQAEESRKAEAAAAIDKTFNERMEALKAEDAEFASVFTGDAAALRGVKINDLMDGFIRSKEWGPKLLRHFIKNPAVAAEIHAMQNFDAAEAIVDIARSLKTPATPEPQKVAPVVLITKAAKPATDIRATSAAPVDELKAAVDAGDFSRFEELQNRRDVERRKRG
jgi:hypothetical protein